MKYITSESRTGISFHRHDFVSFRKPDHRLTVTCEQAPYAQAKLDGNRVAVFYDSGRLRVISTRGHDLWGFLEKRPEFSFVTRIPRDCLVDAEILSGGGCREDVKTALKDRATVLLRGFATTALDAQTSIPVVNEWLDEYGFDPPAFATGWTEDSLEWVRESHPSLEGWVIKSANYGVWQKYKYEKTCDCVITGIVPGTGKYTGKVGAFIVSLEGKEIASVSGMTDDIRDYTWQQLVGCVIEVKYQRVGSKGRLLHPRFLRFREDKSPVDCSLNQLS